MSRCTSKRHKKENVDKTIMPQKRKRRRRRQRKSPTQRRQRNQLGEGVGAVVAEIPKAAWKITKGLETLAKKNARKSHLKRMAEIKSGKRKRYAGESFTCSIV